MMQYDLTNTLLARADEPLRAPNEGELLAILVGLLIARQKTLSEVADAGESLVLNAAACDGLAELLSQKLKPLDRELAAQEPRSRASRPACRNEDRD